MFMSLAKRRADIARVCKDNFSIKFRVGCCVPDPVQRVKAGALWFLSAKGHTALYIHIPPPALPFLCYTQSHHVQLCMSHK